MTDEKDQQQTYQPNPAQTGNVGQDYKPGANVQAAKNILDGIDKLVNTGNLADSYKQQGGQ